MSTLERRVERLERLGPRDGTSPITIYMPDNGRDAAPPGRYPCPNGNAIVVYAGARPPEGPGENAELQPEEAH